MVILKLRLYLEYFEAFFDRWGWLLVGDLENGGQTDDEDVDRLFEMSYKSWLLKRLFKITIICVENGTYVVNTKEKRLTKSEIGAKQNKNELV